jgi:hypothetical protein
MIPETVPPIIDFFNYSKDPRFDRQTAWSDEYLEQLLFQSGFAAQTEPSVPVP